MNRNKSSTALLKVHDTTKNSYQQGKTSSALHKLTDDDDPGGTKEPIVTEGLLFKNKIPCNIHNSEECTQGIIKLDDATEVDIGYRSDTGKWKDNKRDLKYEHQNNQRLKALKTAAAYMSFLPMGMATAIVGATLLQLQSQVSTDQSTIVTLFTWRGIGCIIGNGVAGTLFNKIKQEILFCTSGLALGLSIATVPFYRDFVPMAIAFGIIGVATGVLGAGLNAYMVKIWKHRAPPFIQGLHFAVSFGATLGPLISSPFVGMTYQNNQSVLYLHNQSVQTNLDQRIGYQIHNVSTTLNQNNKSIFQNKSVHDDNYILNNIMESVTMDKYNVDNVMDSVKNKLFDVEEIDNLISNQLSNTSKHYQEDSTHGAENNYLTSNYSELHQEKMSDIFIPYLIIAIVCSVGVLLFIFVLVIDRKKSTITELRAENIKLQTYNKIDTSRYKSGIVITCMSLLCICFGGLEATFGGFITTFGVKYLDFSNFTSALLATTFWGAFATGRGIGIILIHIMESKLIIITDCCLAILSLSLFPLTSKFHMALIFMLCALLGLSLSAAYANILSYTQKHFHMSAKIASIFTISLYIGMMVFPSIVGKEISVFQPLNLIYTLLGLAVFALSVFLFTHWFISTHVNTHTNKYVM